MIVEWIIDLGYLPLLGLINSLPDFNPDVSGISSSLVGLGSLLGTAYNFVPFDVITLTMSNIGFWLGLNFTIAVMRFVKEWIPLMG
jgi:ABC-type polysaccharide transport system permease subunit